MNTRAKRWSCRRLAWQACRDYAISTARLVHSAEERDAYLHVAEVCRAKAVGGRVRR